MNFITGDDFSAVEEERRFWRNLWQGVIFMLIVAIIIGVAWLTSPAKNIVFVEPLTISVSEGPNCDENALRCYTISSELSNPDAVHNISVLGGIKWSATLIALYLTIINFAGFNIGVESQNNEENTSLQLVINIVRNIPMSLAVAIFVWIIFQTIEIMSGLVANVADPLGLNKFVAIMTVGVFALVISFTLNNWLTELNIISIGQVGIAILLVSFSLSIPFINFDLNAAYSALGSTNTAADFKATDGLSTFLSSIGDSKPFFEVVHGSQVFFTLTMFALGFVLWSFTIELVSYYFNNFELIFNSTEDATSKNATSDENRSEINIRKVALIIVSILGFGAGLGSIIVGYFPTNQENIHNWGAIGAPLFSIVMMIILVVLYPRSKSKYIIVSISTFLIIVLLILGALSKFQPKFVTTLQAEFAYFFFFLLFIQIYSSNIVQYTNNIAEQKASESAEKVRQAELEIARKEGEEAGRKAVETDFDTAPTPIPSEPSIEITPLETAKQTRQTALRDLQHYQQARLTKRHMPSSILIGVGNIIQNRVISPEDKPNKLDDSIPSAPSE